VIFEFCEQPLLVFRQRSPCEKVRTPLPRAPERLLQAPPADRRMVARQQHVGHALAIIRLRARVMRTVQQARGKRILLNRLFVAERARQLPHDRVHHEQCRQFPARDDEIADRYLLVDLAGEEPLVDPLVTAREQNETGRARKLDDACMRKRRARRRQVDRLGCRDAPTRLLASRRSERITQWTAHEHHARSTTVWTIVDGAIHVARKVTRVVDAEVPEPAFARAARDAERRCMRDHFGK